MAFWISVGAILVMVVTLFVQSMWRARLRVVDESGTREMQVYRDQLREVENDLARGVISPAEAERLRTEVSRRLLDADRGNAREQGRGPAPKAMRIFAVVVILLLIPISIVIYANIGAIGYSDLPLAERHAIAAEIRRTRPNQAALEAEFGAQGAPQAGSTPAADTRNRDLVAQLRVVLASRPNDLAGHELLANSEASLGNFHAAAEAYARIIAIKAETATAEDYASLADNLILATTGIVSPEAESALEHALQLDPRNGVALYYSGLLFAQTGREDLTFRIWANLHDISAPEDPWMPIIRADLPLLAEIAGENYTLPPLALPNAPFANGLAGPGADDITAAQDLSPEDRAAMVANMVERLSSRLANSGGTSAEWAQLINALGVLGETSRARAIWTEAQTVFAADADAIANLRAAAQNAGVASQP
jgi:cytochrome c-type biogenesis protein CcmH